MIVVDMHRLYFDQSTRTCLTETFTTATDMGDGHPLSTVLDSLGIGLPFTCFSITKEYT